MKLKKLLAFGLIATMTLAFTACGSKGNDTAADEETKTEEQGNTTEEASEDTNSDSEGLSGTVVITGSTSVEKILLDMIDEFQAINPDVKINYTGTGSSAGIQDAIDGVNSLGASSRELKEEETSQGLTADAFAYDGIAVVVHPSNEIADISLEDLAKIYSGQITNWKDLGGKDSEIVVVSREGASGTRGAFEELIKLEDAGGLSEGATVVEGNGNVQTGVAGNENSIGYVSFSFIDETVKALTVGGVEANAENAKAGDYKLSRPFLFAYKAESLTPEAKAFVEFTKTDDAQAYVEAHGGIKIN
ncbi:phosphate ABC transporter substrate-binding protein (PhoT family) [Mobilisporobacter senegalensis]|uniref:Phosphate-binding protein n=1 Tax=Mobilisporobacter senegalensis TaxID=1329262 RepID=A0A3N1XHY5_9FIRM|nr:phosphate ABC transporter substrate-binding protein [Mobilisporobacter senegalensis]ROR26313.1 phosphate ABC transporter substrate-binding protein (PhoT family) [Mobilisporobacter senegalensis]